MFKVFFSRVFLKKKLTIYDMRAVYNSYFITTLYRNETIGKIKWKWKKKEKENRNTN